MAVVETIIGMVIGTGLALAGIYMIRRASRDARRRALLRMDWKTGRLIDQADIEKEFL